MCSISRQPSAKAKERHKGVHVALGQGFNTKTNTASGRCLQSCSNRKSQCLPIYNGQGTLSTYFRLGRRSYMNEIRRMIEFNAGNKVFRLSAKAEQHRLTSSKNLTLSYHFRAQYILSQHILQMAALRPEVRSHLKKGSKAFLRFCGDSFVRERVMGGKLFITLKFTFRSLREKKSFLFRLSLRTRFTSFSKRIQRLSERFHHKTHVQLRVIQLGGDVRDLGMMQRKYKRELRKGCHFSNLQPCKKALEALQRYASTKFPTTLIKKPAVILAQTAPYSNLGIFP